MIITAYQEEAKRTMNRDLGPQQQLAVMMLGIYGETGEVFAAFRGLPENKAARIKDEAGDVFWYVANTCSQLGIEFERLFTQKIKSDAIDLDFVLEMVAKGASAADVVKKTIGQGHVLNLDMLYESLRGVVGHLCAILKHYGLTVQEVLEYNLLKLAKRYPEGKFVAERSIGREIPQ